MNYNNKVVLVTGAANGIGFHTAWEFTEAGATVILVDTDSAGLDKAWRSMLSGGFANHKYICDVSHTYQVERLQKFVASVFGKLDVLVNNAGIGHHGELADTSIKTWRRLVDVNLLGPIHLTQVFLPMLEKTQGQIINVSSGQAFFQLPTWGAYTVTKAALAVFSEILHFELRKKGVGVTTVYPFMVNTGFYNGVEGDTLGVKLSMKLLPYYSMRPETVGRIIYKAVKKWKRVEMVSPINNIGKLTRALPMVPGAMGRITNWLLAGGKNE